MSEMCLTILRIFQCTLDLDLMVYRKEVVKGPKVGMY